MRKQDISLKNLIVANGFKHFIMILMVSWDTVNEGISTKRRDLIEHNNSPQIHESWTATALDLSPKETRIPSGISS